jgi:O-antigen/teichoic acid export membrane protein
MSSNKRIRANLVATGFGQMVTILSQVLLVRLYLQAWGVQHYGHWLVLTAIPAYLAMSDFGIGYVAANKIGMLGGINDAAGGLRVLQTTWMIQVFLSTVAFAFALVLIYCFAGVHGPIYLADRALLSELALYALMGIPISTLAGPYRFAMKTDRALLWINSGRLAEAIVIGCLLYYRCSMEEVGAGMVVTRFVSAIATYVDGRSICHDLYLGCTKFSWKEARELIIPGGSYMLFPAGNAILLQGLTIVISKALGPTSVVVFTTTRTLCRYIFQAMNMIGNSLWSEFSTLVGAGMHEHANDLRRAGVQITVFCSIVSGAILVILGPLIINIWTSGKVSGLRSTIVLLVLDMVAYSLWFINSVVLNATNSHIKLARRFFISATVFIPCAFLMARIAGINGAALSLVLFNASLVFYTWHQVKVLFALPSLSFAQDFTDYSYASGVMNKWISSWAKR